ncbi:MAG: MlaA family lipoprotein, partial [Rhodospirillales bacterium]
MTRAKGVLRLAAWLAAAALLAACATPVPMREGDPPLPDRPPERTVAEMVDIYDPIEGINRQVYAFNYEFDRLVFLPVVRSYKFVLPQVIRDRVNDFLANFDDVVTAANLLLQARPG